MPPVLQALIGYSLFPQSGATAVLGHVDGRHPLKTLPSSSIDQVADTLTVASSAER